MSTVASLIGVLERSGAERLVLSAGDRPHIFAAGVRRDVGSSMLTDAVVKAVAAEMLPQDTLHGAAWQAPAEHVLRQLPNGQALAVRAHRERDTMRLEVVRTGNPRTTAERTDATPRRRKPRLPGAIRQLCETEDGLLVIAAPVEAQLQSLVADAAAFAATQRGGNATLLQPHSFHAPSGHVDRVRTEIVDAARIGTAISAVSTQQANVIAVMLPSAEDSSGLVASATAGRLVIAGVVARSVRAAAERLAKADDPLAFWRAFIGGFAVLRLRALGGGHLWVREVVVPHGGGVSDGGDIDAQLGRAVSRGRISLRTAARYAIDPARVVADVHRQARMRRLAETSRASCDPSTPWTDLSQAI